MVTGDSQEKVIIFRYRQTHMHHNIYIFGLLEYISFSYSVSLGPTAEISGDNETLFVADKKIGVLKVMRPKTWCFVWSTYIVKSYHCSGVTKNVQKKGSVKYDVL